MVEYIQTDKCLYYTTVLFLLYSIHTCTRTQRLTALLWQTHKFECNLYFSDLKVIYNLQSYLKI